MQFCQAHWDTLRTAISDAGLAGLVAESGEQAASQLMRAETEEASIDNFDPLMQAHLMILDHAAKLAGWGVLFMDGCPLCEMNKVHAEGCKDPACGRLDYFDDWIDYAVHDVKAIVEGFTQ